jgi:hypothetical protein
MEHERRGATRYNFGAIAEVVDLDGRGEVVSLTRDLSFSGVFVKTTTPLPTGTRYECALHILAQSSRLSAMSPET